MASLRERRGGPTGSEQGFNLSGGFQQAMLPPPNSLCPSPVHTETPHLLSPFLTKIPPGTGAGLRSPGLPECLRGWAKVPAKVGLYP